MKDKKYQLLTRARRLVIKVGSSTLTHPTGKLNLFQMDKLVQQIADLKNQGIEVILVSSGAVSAGMGKMGYEDRPKSMPEKQALAAVGQGILLHMYEKLFNDYGHTVAQILLTRDDIQHRSRYLNARNALLALLKMDTVPIINENDTVAVEELKFGENDTLSALVATLVDADLLVILSDIDGLYTADPREDENAKLIDIVEKITSEIKDLAGDAGSKQGSGGMITKIEAARIAYSSGIPMIVAKGNKKQVLQDIVSGKNPGTLFVSDDHRLSSRKGWIAFASKSSGKIWLDSGAEKAIVLKGKSLLPSGITRVEGDFDRGFVVSVMSQNNNEIARGIVNYKAADIDKIKGCHSQDIQDVLGYKEEDEVVHRDNLSLRN